MKLAALTIALGLCAAASVARASVPGEPIDLGIRLQFFADDYLVDNRFAVKGSACELVLRKFRKLSPTPP